MNKINILPDNLANQIAAGEVVERPASVVKELIENAIDAGARRLEVDIELGGRRLMMISDDGEGMTRDDAILAFERHATSKIRTLEDLGHIGTLGFRGEALASIASVARVELVTKNDSDPVATKVSLDGGRLLDVKDAARDRGTTIIVRDLFFNTPARRKFMRSEATENYHLTSIVTHYALAHPEIAFALTNNGREVLRAATARDLRERAFQLFGGDMIESLIPVDGGREYVAKVAGFVSAPRERRTTRDSQYFFVNQRFVRDKIVADGLREGYRSILPHGVYPVAFLFLDLPLDEIDVNVHPAKTEVRFRRGEAVKDVIAEAVRLALSNAGIHGDRAYTERSEEPFALREPVQPPAEPTQPGIEFGFGQRETWAIQGSAPVEAAKATDDPEPLSNPRAVEDLGYQDLDENRGEFEDLAERRESEDENPPLTDTSRSETEAQPTIPAPVLPPVDSAARLVSTADVRQVSRSAIQPLGQLHESFIIATDDEGMLLIDQHVAHERILFDQYRKGEIDRSIESQNLLLPETIDLTPAQSAAFELVETDLEVLGFGVIRLSGRTIAIKSIPTDLAGADARNLFAEILDTIDVHKKGSAKSTFRDDIAASLACKAAIKVNMRLTPEKMRWLIDELLVTTSPTTCPHGRPVILRLTMHDIEKGFHRI